VSASRAICADCGHVQSWHERDTARAMAGAMRAGEIPGDRRCYREVGGAACRCGGFRDSGEAAIDVRRGQGSLSGARFALVAVLLVVMGIGLLYAYRSQSPALSSIPYGQALAEVGAGQVARVTIVGDRATLGLRSGEQQQTTLPDQPVAFQKALDDYNAANPARPISYEYQAEGTSFAVLGSILLSLLPLVLLGAFFVYLLFRRRSASR
jgi:hypothetical protein